MVIGPLKGQTVRNQASLEKIFQEAGLTICAASPETVLHDQFTPAKIWALS